MARINLRMIRPAITASTTRNVELLKTPSRKVHMSLRYFASRLGSSMLIHLSHTGIMYEQGRYAVL